MLTDDVEISWGWMELSGKKAQYLKRVSFELDVDKWKIQNFSGFKKFDKIEHCNDWGNRIQSEKFQISW